MLCNISKGGGGVCGRMEPGSPLLSKFRNRKPSFKGPRGPNAAQYLKNLDCSRSELSPIARIERFQAR